MTEARTDDVGGLWLRVSRGWLAAGATLTGGGTALGQPAASEGVSAPHDRVAHPHAIGAAPCHGHG